MQDGLGDELLDLVGVDVGLAAAGEARPSRAGIAALAARPSAARPAARRSGCRRAGRRAGSGARSCSCAAPGRRASRGSALRPRRLMIPGHTAVGDDLAVVLALAADPRRGEHPPQALRRPCAAARRATPRSFRSLRDRPHRLARQEPPRALAHDRRLRRAHRHLVGLVAVRSAAATRDAAAPRRSPRACAGSGGSCRRSPSSPPPPRIRAWNCPSVRRQINVAAHRGHVRQPQPLAQIDERLQLARLAVQPIEVIDQQPIDRPRAAESSSIRSYSGRCLPLQALTSSSTYRSTTCQPLRSASRSQSSICRSTPSRSPSRSDEIRA